MRTPILVVETDTKEVFVFKTQSEAESYIEPPDIDVYDVFDSEGFELRPSLKTPEGILGIRRVQLIPSGQQRTEDLRAALERYLGILGLQLSRSGTPLN